MAVYSVQFLARWTADTYASTPVQTGIKVGSGGRAVERRTVNRVVQTHLPPFRNLGKFVFFTFVCLSEEIQKACSPFYLVSIPGEVVTSHTGGKCLTCSGLTNSRWTLNALQRAPSSILERRREENGCIRRTRIMQCCKRAKFPNMITYQRCRRRVRRPDAPQTAFDWPVRRPTCTCRSVIGRMIPTRDWSAHWWRRCGTHPCSQPAAAAPWTASLTATHRWFSQCLILRFTENWSMCK